MIDFIENIGDYFSQHFFTDDFPKKVFDKSGFVSQGKNEAGEKVENHISGYNQSVGALRRKYDKFKNDFLLLKRTKDKAKLAHDFNTELLKVLGYQNGTKSYDQPVILEDNKVIPVRCRFNKGGKPYLYVMEMMPMIQVGDDTPDGLYEQNYTYEDWESVLPESFEGYEIKPEVIKDALSELFLLPENERPEYLIMLAGPKVFLIQYEKWKYDSYLLFDLEELFVLSQIPANKNFLALFYALLAKNQFISESESVLSSLEEDAHKASYGVTKTLKNAVIFAVESLANEAIEYKKSKLVSIEDKKEIVTLLGNEKFAQELKDDCLTFVYRLLFLFYAESREDLEILPVNDSTYQKGYSMEMLRDLEMVQLTTDSSKNGFFFSDSLWQLFEFLHEGRDEKDGFVLKPLDSPLFDNSVLNHLGGIRFRNCILQEIVLRLSLSERTRNKSRGRISYSNLGINQLGSVYESLLAYSGFFSKEDLIEVKAAKDKTGKDGTFLVPKSRRDDFEEAEIIKNPEIPSEDATVKSGRFVYRLNGRDRKKSASYYTPEVLTQCTVKYTLKGILENLRKKQNVVDGELKGEYCADEILKLKILEPAMGAAAFQNEVINQLSVAYLELKEHEEVHRGRKRIVPGNYKDEQQRVKAYIAANNVYGVDLNPTAVELGKLSLWLNCMHKNMETPFFGHRLGAGNAVVGAWLKVYNKSDIIEEFPSKGTPAQRNKSIQKEWWSKSPVRVQWEKEKLNRKEDQVYHFLLPDENMVPSYKIKLLKEKLSGVEIKAFTDWKSAFKAPISKDEHKRLSKISRVIDHLLDEHYKEILGVIKDTTSVYLVYGQDNPQVSIKGYDEKERLADSRNKRTAPYYKLKMVMDYWCSLWFWDVRDVVNLPSRSQWYNEIESLLNIDTSSLPENATEQDIKTELRKKSTDLSLFASSDRIETVEELSKKHRYFHNELEFIEVFRERSGFDVIVGNPPWVKYTFTIGDVVSDYLPEIVVKGFDAAKTKKTIEINSTERISQIIEDELLEYEGNVSFLSGMQNYPYLKGQQTDLYKCILGNSFDLLTKDGAAGMVHPESVFNDPKGQAFRKEIYPRMKYHFQFKNEKMLFAEISHTRSYSASIYSGSKSEISFDSINNLYDVSTITGIYSHDGEGQCAGTKIKDEQVDKMIWNTRPHKNRVVHYDYERLNFLRDVFEKLEDIESVKLVSIHSSDIFEILKRFEQFSNKVNDYEYESTVGWDQTIAIAKGIIKKSTQYCDLEKYELILSGPHFFVATPLYKNPKIICNKGGDYEPINLVLSGNNFIPKTNYLPAENLVEYKDRIKFFKTNLRWIDHYKLAFSKMLDNSTERTLQSAILPPKVSHINGVISVIFKDATKLLEFAGLTASILFDFYVKTLGKTNLYDETISKLPINIEERFKASLISRVLWLNCMNHKYADLWSTNFSKEWRSELWSKNDNRLPDHVNLSANWNTEFLLDSPFSRRMALVEIDVIVSQAFGLTLDQHIFIYEMQFPVMQQNEEETWYDQKGEIVFTCSRGLPGVGVGSSEWKLVKEFKKGQTYNHILEKSELYEGETITYYAPFDKCDRVEDYKITWAHFEKVFNQEKIETE